MLVTGSSEVSNALSNYTISNSLRFQSASSQYLSRTVSAGASLTTWTWSSWVKRGTLGVENNLFAAGLVSGTFYYTRIFFDSSDRLVFANYNDSNTGWLTTTQVFRDPSAWYHIVIVYNSTSATASNRMRVYVNGSEVTAFTTGTFAPTYPAQNTVSIINNNSYTHWLGQSVTGLTAANFDGYQAEINFVNAQALTPSSFGATNPYTGQWQAQKYTGTYGTNGFYLPFSNGTSTTTLGTDSSGNNNNWTLTNFTRSAGVNDCWMYDVPSGNGTGPATQPSSNYCVMNPLSNNPSYANPTNGNLKCAMGTAGANGTGLSTLSMSSGKWYCEFIGGGNMAVGIIKNSQSAMYSVVSGALYLGQTSDSYSYYGDGRKVNNGSFIAYGASFSAVDTIGVAYDADAGSITFYKNNTSQGVAFSGLSGEFFIGFSDGSGAVVDVNFGQRSFAYTPPTGFVALCTSNLPASTAPIVAGNKQFDVNIWTGNGTSQTITNSGSMQPDLVWTKSRSVNGYYHVLIDSVRGITKALYSNATDAENTLATRITSINSNGFTVGSSGDMNDNLQTFVAWQWKAGGTPATTNTDGSIASVVSVNRNSGFSIVTYTGNGTSGATIGHGLGVAPKMIIVKNRTNTVSGNGNWPVYHVSTGNTNYTSLNLTNASAAASGFWNNTSPTSTVFTVGNTGTVNDSGFNYVAYCFAEIAGFSKFGSYTGNGSADGPFIYCGFRPKYVMFKNTTTAGYGWAILDSSRNTYNITNLGLDAASSTAEFTIGYADFLSNGIKFRTTDSGANKSNDVYIYMAFAENPFQYANAR